MFANVIKRSPTNSIIAVTTPLLLGSEINMEAATPLVNHKDTRVRIITRFEDASSAYRRWREMARSLSTPMAVTVRNNAHARKKEKKETVTIFGQRKSKVKFALPANFNMTAIITPNISCPNNPTARSEQVRLRNNFFILAGIDEAFHRARITRRFPSVVTRKKAKWNTQMVNTKVASMSTSLLNFARC